jgi:NAD+ diphosphatase
MPLTAFHNTYAGNPLDRAGERRSDAAWIAARLADSRSQALAMWNGQPLAAVSQDGGSALRFISATLAKELAGGEEPLLFLGLRADETAVFALDLEGTVDPAASLLQPFDGAFEGLRGLAPRLNPEEAAIAAQAKAVFEWRRRHRFCSACGRPSEVADAGWKRICPACSIEHFPRTDPVVIMLAIQTPATQTPATQTPATQAAPDGERCLLGRQTLWPPGLFSTLAGFMEPGESIEEACARELKEEASLDTLHVRYHSSQPWPYPSNLMIGLIAEVGPGEGQPDQTELEAIRWFTKAQARALLRGELKDIFAPPSFAIAHHLLKSWAGA